MAICQADTEMPYIVNYCKHIFIKVAEHSFCVHFYWCNSVRAQAPGILKTNMLSIQRSFYLLNTHTICVTFLYN